MFRQKPRGSDLRALELFADCTPSELAAVDAASTRLWVEAGRVLLREGDADRQFMVIVEGEVGVSRQSGSLVAVLSPGDFLGEMAMLTGERRSATATALTAVQLLVCNGGEFAALVERAPSVKAKLVAAAASRATENALAA